MKQLRKKLAALFLAAAACISLAAPVSAAAEGWRKDGTGWWYQDADGGYPAVEWRNIHYNKYYFDADGYMATGWQIVDGEWYYLCPRQDGALPEGAMASGVVEIDGRTHCFGPDGAAFRGTRQENGWYCIFSDRGEVQYAVRQGYYQYDCPEGWTVTDLGRVLDLNLDSGQEEVRINVSGVDSSAKYDLFDTLSQFRQAQKETIERVFSYGPEPAENLRVTSRTLRDTQAEDALVYDVRFIRNGREMHTRVSYLFFDGEFVQAVYAAPEDCFADHEEAAEELVRSIVPAENGGGQTRRQYQYRRD